MIKERKCCAGCIFLGICLIKDKIHITCHRYNEEIRVSTKESVTSLRETPILEVCKNEKGYKL